MATVRPTISVFVPAYNREKYVKECIESVLKQSVQPDQFFAIDDGSSDKTLEILGCYTEHGLEVISQAHKGAPETRSSGIKHCRTDYMITIGSDDVMLPRSIESLLRAYEKDLNKDLYYGNLIGTDSNLKFQKQICYPDLRNRPHWLESGLALTNMIGDGFGMIKVSWLKENGYYDPFFFRAHDWDIWSRGCSKMEISKVETALGLWRWHTDNLTANGNKSDHALLDDVIRERMRVRISANKHIENFGWESLFTTENKEVFIWGAGSYGRAMLDMLHYMGLEVLGFVDSSENKIGSIIDSLRVYSWNDVKLHFANSIIVIASVYEHEIARFLTNESLREGVDFFRVHGVQYHSV